MARKKRPARPEPNQFKFPPGFEQACAILGAVESETDDKLAIESVKLAIRICPQSVDAYLWLAEFESNPAQIAEIYREAAEQGRWMIDAIDCPDVWNNPLLATYLNFRLQMSDHLWNYGQRVDSVEHLMDIDRLDPDDKLGSRFRLAFRLFDLGWDDELNELIEESDGFGSEACDKLLETLIEYRDQGDSNKARHSLMECASYSPRLIEYLVGEAMLPLEKSFVTSMEPFEEDAISLAHIVLPIVRGLPGLGRWMRETLDFRPQGHEPTKEDREYELKMVSGLPQSDEEWILDCTEVGEVWLLFVYSVEFEEPIRIESFSEKPTSAILWEAVLDTMRDPKGDARRPTKILVSKATLAKSWKKRCERLSIECIHSKSKLVPKAILEDVLEMMNRTEANLEIDQALMEEIGDLPQQDDTWIVGIFKPPLWISDGATPRRPSVIVVVESEHGMVLMQDMDDDATTSSVKNALLKAMTRPLIDIPAHRPSMVLVHDQTDLDDLDQFLDAIDIECSVATTEESEPLDECVESLIRHVSGPEGRVSLIDVEGITENEVGLLFQSIARFWKIAPWRTVPGDRPIELRCELFQQKVWYAIVVGQMGMNLGLVLYDEKEAMDAVMTSDSENAEPNGLFLNYLEKFEIPAIDFWFQEKYQWQVASEEAYPLIERALPKLQHRRPTRDELIALDIALRILPPFISRPETEGSFQIPVTTFGERVEVQARWI